ncbi:TPA: hypothetical protein DEP21_04355 [Patescibacteria group bacterium]|nr:hypothetical protein [Candidatus Gracilibacteria bacterium]
MDSGDVKKLYLAGVLAGIGINIKYHAIIFYLPLFLSLLYLYKKNSSSTTLSNLLIVVPNFVLQTIFFWISVRYFPTNWYVFLPITLLMIGVQIFLYKKSEQIYKTIKHFVEKIEVTNLYTV